VGRQISYDRLMDVSDSKYLLVVAAAKRARQLTEQFIPAVETEAKKPVTVALQEIERQRLRYIRPDRTN